jgi:short-subunit dehydrogenase
VIVAVTGAGRGIGAAVAARFAADGEAIVLAGGRDAARLEATAAALRAAHPGLAVDALPGDLATVDGRRAVAAALGERAIDVLVNNAGAFTPGRIHDEPEGVLERMIETNLYSAYAITRAVVPGMIARRRGHVFTLCSVASIQAYPNGGAYGVSKYALLGLTRNLREELKPHGVKVTAVLPGATYTDSWAPSGIPASRMAEAAAVAALIAAATRLSAAAVVEDIVLRPQLGDV